jgi:hypothetical protein
VRGCYTMAVSEPFPESLCHRCVHLRLVQTERSTFLLCKHPALPKYPPQPVRTCPGFVAR